MQNHINCTKITLGRELESKEISLSKLLQVLTNAAFEPPGTL